LRKKINLSRLLKLLHNSLRSLQHVRKLVDTLTSSNKLSSLELSKDLEKLTRE
jgi:hypothetical protein